MTNVLFDALFYAHRHSNAPFIIQPDGPDFSYRDFLDLTARIAGALNSLGVKTGDRVAVQVAKTPQALALYMACVQTGAVLLPLNTGYTPHEVAYFLTDAEPALLVCDPASVAELTPLADQVGAKLATLTAQGSGSLMDMAKPIPETVNPVARGADDLAAILYTSGTTGRSKGAMMSHANLLSNAETLAQEWRFTADDRLLHALPIFHTHGLFVAINTLAIAGGSMVFLPGFDLDKIIAALPQSTSLMGVPTFYTRLLDDSRFTRDLVAHMRLFVSGSAPLLAVTHDRFYARTGHRILERYGMTETNMNTSNPYEGVRKPGTVGPPLAGVELRIMADGKPVPVGEIGGIEVRGPNVFSGYWRMPEKTAEEFTEDGFFMTGDLGKLDFDGYVQIVGRSKDLIIAGGYNIYPKEIEQVLDKVDGVIETAVVGVPHADFGESVVAVVATSEDIDSLLPALQTAAEDNLAAFKRPRKYVGVTHLVRNTMGKVQKNILREQLA